MPLMGMFVAVEPVEIFRGYVIVRSEVIRTYATQTFPLFDCQ